MCVIFLTTLLKQDRVGQVASFYILSQVQGLIYLVDSKHWHPTFSRRFIYVKQLPTRSSRDLDATKRCKIFLKKKQHIIRTNIKWTFISLMCTTKCSRLASFREKKTLIVCSSQSLLDDIDTHHLRLLDESYNKQHLHLFSHSTCVY